MFRRVGFLSFRFGPTDGVSVVARTWMDVFRSHGCEVVTITGEEGSDRLVTGFGIPDPPDPEPPADPAALDAALEEALADIDLVVVENLLTIPLNLPASRSASRVLAGRPAIVHHHDPPWHRERFAHITELPTADAAWRHVAINHLLRRELAERGIDAEVIHNAFPFPDNSADRVAALRAEVRGAVGLTEDEIVVAHPVRAIERKNVPAAVDLAESLGATYWLLGPAEEGYGDTLEEILAGATCRVVHRPWDDTDGIYAAADHIAFPSTWEGFGNPPIEAALHRRPVTVGDYGVARELRVYGFRWFEVGDAAGVATALADPNDPRTVAMLDLNESIARSHFGLDRMAGLLWDVARSLA